jgi:hypothetical protein
MNEKLNSQSKESSFYDVVMQDTIEFASIEDNVLECGMSSMTGSLNK